MLFRHVPGKNGNVVRKISALIVFSATIICLLCMQVFAETPKIQFNIPSQDMSSALMEFANRTDLSLIYDIEKLGKLKTNAVSGVYSPIEALGIILYNTGLHFELIGEQTIAITKNKSPSDKR